MLRRHDAPPHVKKTKGDHAGVDEEANGRDEGDVQSQVMLWGEAYRS